MVGLAPPLNYLQERNSGFVPREIYDAETGYVFNLSHYLVCISFFELMTLIGCLPKFKEFSFNSNKQFHSSHHTNQLRIIAPATLLQHSSNAWELPQYQAVLYSKQTH